MRHSKSLLGVLLGCGAAAALGLASAPAVAKVVALSPKGPGSLTGVWFNSRFTTVRDRRPEVYKPPPPRPLPPFQPWALAVHQQHLAESADGRPYNPMTSTCLPEGMPAMMFPPGQLPIDILETPGEVTILFEEQNAFRKIYLNVPHEADPDPTLFGDSIGHWEGDTLVVDTVAIDIITPMESDIFPHSDALHTVERMRRAGPDQIEVSMLIEDPKALTHAYTRTETLIRVPGQKIRDFHCTNNRNPPDASGHTGVTLEATKK
jgi:hypothetical protein